jgi:acyl-CoA hydrolase
VYTSTHTACSKVTALAVNKATWEKKKICEGYFFFVAIDSMMRPIPIPQFVVENEDEQIEWDKAEQIRTHMLNHKSD